MLFPAFSKVEKLSKIICRPKSSSRIAKEEEVDCINSESGSVSNTKTPSPAGVHWIREIEQNKLFKKVRQEIDKNWEKFLEKKYAGEDWRNIIWNQVLS